MAIKLYYGHEKEPPIFPLSSMREPNFYEGPKNLQSFVFPSSIFLILAQIETQRNYE